MQDIAATLKPVVIDGHLNIARSVGAGEYWVALNNYVALTINMKLSGAPTDFWALDPVTLAFGSVGISAQAPHPKAAQLGANFMLSREAQQFLTRFTETEGVLFVGRAQEKALVWRTQRRYSRDGSSYAWLVRSSAFVNYFYF